MWPAAWVGVLLLVLVLAALALLCALLLPRASPFPGPPNGEARALFQAHLEDAHLLLLRRFAPSRTLSLDTVTCTADPELLARLLNSRAHSVGRSLVYRLIAWVMPVSDGILFAAGEAWQRRHRLFTPLFQPGVVKGYVLVACAGMARVARAAAARGGAAAPAPGEAAPEPSAQALAQCVEGAGGSEALLDLVCGDLLSLVRSGAMRTFLAWTAGVDPDAPGEHAALVQRTARAFDVYGRVCFDAMPLVERSQGFGLAWLRDYWQLRGVAAALRACVAQLAAARPFAPLSSVSPPPDTHLSAMLAQGWSLEEVTSELNHLHGAHKAVAFMATAALAELSECHPSLRARLRAELVGVCGEAPAAPAGSDAAVGGAGAGAGAGAQQQQQQPPSWRPPTKEDWERLPLLSCVWRETLRRHAVSMGTLRSLGEDFAAGAGEGAAPLLPKGSDVMCLLHALHHDAELWGPDAHCWEPERWDRGSEYWAKRRAWELEAGSSSSSGSGGSGSSGSGSGSRFWSEASASSPGGAFIPAAHKGAFLPFLEGLRRCAGMHLAQLQFAALVYAMVVPWRVELAMPEVAAGESLAAAGGGRGGVGGGTALLPGAACRGRRGCLAVIAEPRLPFTTPSRLDLDAGAAGAALHLRLHLVKRPDMFTTWDGHLPYRLVAEN